MQIGARGIAALWCELRFFTSGMTGWAKIRSAQQGQRGWIIAVGAQQFWVRNRARPVQSL